jgi:hypothetical protein
MEEPDPQSLILGSLAREERLARVAAMGVPAFIRRAQAVDAAVERLHAQAAAEWAKRLRGLFPLARALDASARAGPALPPWAVASLEQVRVTAGFASRTAPPERRLDRTLAAFAARIAVFNQRWRSYVQTVSLEEVHAAQTAYNLYYAIERELALRDAPPVVFRPLAMFDRAELAARFPGLQGP